MKKQSFIIILSAFAIITATSCGNKGAKKSSGDYALNDLRDSFSFAAGFNYGLQLKERELTDINFESLIDGMKDAFSKDSGWLITPELYEEIVKKHLSGVQEASSEKNIAESKAFIAKMAGENGVQRSETGLLWKVIQEGNGPSPNITDTVLIHLRVEFPDGKLFEDTREYNEPIKIPIAGAWPGMVEGLQLMRSGAIYEFYVPYELGFGKNPQMRGVPPNKSIKYTIEMFDIL